jgi:hypothetical protein
MLPYQIIAGGSFTSDASVARQEVQVSDRPDLIWVRNRTAWGDDAAETSVESWWRYGMAQDAAQTVDQANASGILSSEAVTANGFRVYNTANPPTYSVLAGTAVSRANGAVITMANTGSIQVGDIVQLSDTTGMLQISQYAFEVTAVTANVNITINLDSQAATDPNFSADGTAANVQLVIPGRMYPRWRYLVNLSGSRGITQAAQCVASFSVAHDFSVGEYVSFRVPSQFGMTEINNKKGIVQSVTTYSITVDIDTSGYSAFEMPTSAEVASSPFTPAVVVPAGAGPTPNGNPPGVSVQAAADSRNEWVIIMGSNVITSTSAVYDWVAMKYDQFSS